MELTTEQYNDLPDYAKEGFAESEGAFIPVKDAALKTTLNNLDKEKRALQSQYETEKSERNETIRVATENARNEAIEEAAKKGNWEEQERLLREKFNDELNRKLEEERNNVSKEFTVKQEQDALKNDIKLLATELAIDEDARATVELILSQRAKLDENGKRNYFGEDGSALSIADFKSFAGEVEQSKSLARLIKGKTPTKGGGLANGGGGFSSANGMNAKAQQAIKSGDLTGFLNASINNK